MAPKKGVKLPVAAKKKNKAVLLTYNLSWADKVENDKGKVMMNPVLEKRPKQVEIGGAIPPKRDMHKRMIPKQVPPALNQFTNTLDKNLGSSSSYTSALVDESNFSALFDEEGISPISDENYANQMQLQEVLMSAVISSTLHAPKKGPVAAKKKNKAVLLTYNPSWADYKVENESSNNSSWDKMMMNPVLGKRPKQFGIGGANAIPPNRDMHKVVNIQSKRMIPKQQFKVPPALNHFTNTLGSSSSYTSALVDEFNFSALFDEEGISPVSDENYANQMQLQEVLMSAVISSTLRNTQPSEEEIPPSKKGKKVAENNVGHTSQSRSFCNICFDYKGIEEMFPSTGCRHTFCKDCISKYVASKIHGNVTSIKCPDMNCREGDIGPDICREIVPKEVLERWENVLCESLIIGSQKFYCPFKDCSAVMMNDGEEKVTSSECPNCRRLFCAQCNVAWHAGIDCSQFKSLKENERENVDIMLMELAKKKKWRRCPKCQFYVEKKSGCLHIRCRCGYEFCYGCGSIYTSSHACQWGYGDIENIEVVNYAHLDIGF